MNDSPKKPNQDDKQKRLQEALRENLKRRKQQQRERKTDNPNKIISKKN